MTVIGDIRIAIAAATITAVVGEVIRIETTDKEDTRIAVVGEVIRIETTDRAATKVEAAEVVTMATVPRIGEGEIGKQGEGLTRKK